MSPTSLADLRTPTPYVFIETYFYTDCTESLFPVPITVLYTAIYYGSSFFADAQTIPFITPSCTLAFTFSDILMTNLSPGNVITVVGSANGSALT
jgi:hypothetical protein